MPEGHGYRVRSDIPWQMDTVLAACLVAGVLAFEGSTASLIREWTVPVVTLGSGVALVMRRRWVAVATVVWIAAAVVPVVFGQSFVLNGPIDVLLCVPFLLAYTLGSVARLPVGLAGVALLAAALQTGGNAFNPFFEMITIGPWLAGRIIRSRHLLNLQLAARNLELEAERERFARESVRYERARIARELHDMVGHCLSVMVIQAGAGQRLVASDPASVTGVFDSIAEAVQDAQAEIDRLVDLLAVAAEGGTPDLALVDELVRRASRAGLKVSCRWIGNCHDLGADTANVAYRVVQESMTNAFKYAPGSPVEITLRATDSRLEVEVINVASQQRSSGLERSGGGRGLMGMGERVASCGGTLVATSTATGGWKVAASLPRLAPDPPTATFIADRGQYDPSRAGAAGDA
jgi:signal transduction histidine kinase